MAGAIPLKDASREPSRFPLVTTSLILVNCAVFVLELRGGDALVTRWALVPADITSRQHLVTIVTAMFLHNGWMHIIGNMIFLLAFGPQIEDAMGPARYVTFYLLSGCIGFLAQVAAAPSSTIPNLGASGAIAGVMGAFLVTYPGDRVKTVILLGIFVRVTLVPAALLIGLWFLIQVLSQVGVVADADPGSVAYVAHVGGFLFGAVTARAFERLGRASSWGT